MATFKAYGATDIVSDGLTWNGTVTEANSNTYAVSNGNREAVYEGSGLYYRSDYLLLDGRLQAWGEYDRGGNLLAEAYGFNLSAASVNEFVYYNETRNFLSVVLAGDDTITGSDFSDRLAGFSGNDVIKGGLGVNYIDGGSGFDYAVYDGFGSDFFIERTSNGAVYLDRRDGAIEDTLVSIERVLFDNVMVAFDEGAAAGYRLYQAAFDRVPDLGGLSYWVNQLDMGRSLYSAAADFIGSAEFRGLYGSNTSDEQFIDLLYRNVLDRPADNAGYDYWLDRMDSGYSRSEVLVAFSDSQENRVNVAGAIKDGVPLDPTYFA